MAELELNTRANKGRRLTYLETDANWNAIKDAINKDASLTATLNTGNNSINHGKGRKALYVSFFDSNGDAVEFRWKRDPADALNKIIVIVPSSVALPARTDIEINIIT